MARYTTTVPSAHHPQDAFRFVADLRNLERWDPGVSASDMIEGNVPGEGTVYRVTVNGFDLDYRTERYDEGRFNDEPHRPATTVARARTRILESLDTITVTATPTGSDTTYDAELTLNGPLSILDPVLSLIFNRIGDKAADGLRRALQSSTLPPNPTSSNETSV